MIGTFRKLFLINDAPLELTSLYGLSLPSEISLKKRQKAVEKCIKKMGEKYLAVSMMKGKS